MRFAAPLTISESAPADQRPRDDELDLFGMTHPGRVRADNEDHFLLCTVHPQVVIHGTSLRDPERLALRGQRLATVLLVADGVGGSVAGSTASRLATEAVTRHIASSLRSSHTAGTADDGDFVRALAESAIDAHELVRAEALAEPEQRGMATTLSVGVVVWPWLYVVQVGDSRCYFYRDGVLRQVTRDQTFAQDLVECGAMPPERAKAHPLSHVLSSAIGAQAAVPEVSRVDVRERGCVVLLCTDGLTKHVSDAEIADQLGMMQSAEQVCGALLQLALDRGGSDNVTLVVGRARPSARRER